MKGYVLRRIQTVTFHLDIPQQTSGALSISQLLSASTPRVQSSHEGVSMGCQGETGIRKVNSTLQFTTLKAFSPSKGQWHVHGVAACESIRKGISFPEDLVWLSKHTRGRGVLPSIFLKCQH